MNIYRTITLVLLIMIGSDNLQGSDFKQLIPISNKIVCLYFEDGYINHPKLGQVPWIDGEAFIFPIDSILAASKLTYSVVSEMDSNFLSPVNPSIIGRKTKGIDFLDKETPGKKYNYRIPGHCIYLKFEKPFKNNIQYTVHFPGLAKNQESIQFVYNETENVSQAVHVNQIGYSTEARLKYGYVYHWMGEMGALKLDLTTPKSYQLLYWKQVLKRLGKYSNILTWEIMNENVRNESFQDEAGYYFYKHDEWKRLVCTSDGTTDDAVWPDKTWMGFSIIHTCTGSTEKYDLADWYLSVARNTRSHGKPAFNNESGREKRHKNDDPVHRRKQGWLFSSAGCFWTFHAWEGCEGINDTIYNGPGAEYLLPMKQFFDSIPFWQMHPNFTACQLQNDNLVFAALSTPDREVVLTYICSRETGEKITDEIALIRLPDGNYNINFYNPADLRLLGTLQIESTSLGLVSSIELPDFKDDLVLKITRETQKEKTLIKGTQ